MKLSEGFNLLATAPDGIKRLRELILSLAVQGKLVPQDPSDQPASELLKQIRAEKDRLISKGKIRKDKPLPEIGDNEKPFELPEGWAWGRLNDIIHINSGDGLTSTQMAASGQVPVYGGNGVTGFHNVGNVSEPTLVIGRVGYYCGSIHITPEIAWVTDNAFITQFPPKHIYMRFLYWLLKGTDLKENESATAQPVISGRKLYPIVIALPPFAEQTRIVAKLEELMALCDALETRGALESKQHAQLTATLFDALAASESAHQLQENWTRLASSFDLILDRPAAVDALEQTLLQLAVRGLLVEQDPNDQPASELLKQIRAEKDRLIAEGKIKGDKPEAASFDDAPYELPEKWEWTTIGEIISSMGSGWSPACLAEPQATPDQWAVLKTTAVQLMEYQAKQNKLLPSILEPRPEIEAQNGDILITRAGPRNRVGISCLVQNTPPKLMISDKIVRFHVLGKLINPQFVVLCLNAGWSYQRLDAAKSGMAESQVNISQGDLRAIPLPLCTLAEQTRIVARVEALRTLCADLRARLAASQKTQTHLAGALVAGCV